MPSDKENEEKIAEIERLMASPDFWADKNKAQSLIKKREELKSGGSGDDPEKRYDEGHAVLTIFSGAGGDDAEDFSRMLFDMYLKFIKRKNWAAVVLHENKNDQGGYRNVTLEIKGRGAYGVLKKESGVHRLVRISPFNAKKLRHTSFSLVEVIPKFEKSSKNDIEIRDDEIKVDFARSSGPGGQNVNKRETAVRIIHLPTKLSVHVDSERSQHANKEKALDILRGKIYRMLEDHRIKKVEGMYVSKTTEIEWGNQIRSYVLHPYKMVKDHRTNFETSNADAVLNGYLDEFIEAERAL